MIRVASIAEGLGKPPGRYLVEHVVTTLASGAPLTLHIHILKGSKPGPTVGIVSGLHGDEISTAELVLALAGRVLPEQLCGSLLLVPMASALTFETGTRNTTLDFANLNRVFPGSPTGTVTEMLAHALCSELLPACDYLLDTHSEPDTMAIRCCYAFAPVDAYGSKSTELAKRSGCPIVYTMTSLSGSLAEVARQRGIVAVLPETGGPLPGPEGLLEESITEILNMLHHLGMVDAATAPTQEPVLVDHAAHLRAPAGGLFRPMVGFEEVGKCMQPNRLLGSIVSVFTGEELAQIRTPNTTTWLMMARGRTSRVHPGDPLYILGSIKAG